MLLDDLKAHREWSKKFGSVDYPRDPNCKLCTDGLISETTLKGTHVMKPCPCRGQRAYIDRVRQRGDLAMRKADSLRTHRSAQK